MPERGPDPTNVEVEWQLDALDLRPVERWLGAFPRVAAPAGAAAVVISIAALPLRRTVDVYLDTEDWRIGRSGFVLRVRRQGDQGEVTLKDTSAAVAGLRQRIELTQPLPAAGLHSLDPEGPVAGQLRALTGNAPLRHLFEIRTRRRPYQLCLDDVVLGEVDLDDTIIVLGDDQYPVRMRRVEVEVQPQWLELLTPLVEQLRQECALQPAILSKFEAGLLSAGLSIPSQPDLGPTDLGPEPTVGDVVLVVLRRNLASMLAHEAGTRLGDDIEHLHDMRVATRRLRAALTLFDDYLPGHVVPLQAELAWLAAELGVVRDLDVQLERLDSWRQEIPGHDPDALSDLGRVLSEERESARVGMLVSLDSGRYTRLVSDFVSFLRPDPQRRSSLLPPAAETAAAVVIPGLVRSRHRAAVTAARRARRTGDLADFHRLRIRCKRLRYALEFVSEIYEGRTRRFVRSVVGLQDCLGLIQDDHVAAARLQRLATQAGTGLSPATVFAMGSIAEGYRRDAKEQMTLVPGLLSVLKGSRWRRLRAVMERRRLEAGSHDRRGRSPAPDRVGADRSAPTPVVPTPGDGRSEPNPWPPLSSLWRADGGGDDADWDDDMAPLRTISDPPPLEVPPGAGDAGRGGPRPGGRESDRPGGSPRPSAEDPSTPSTAAGRSGPGKEPVFLPPPSDRGGPLRQVPRSGPAPDEDGRSAPDLP